VISEVVFDHLQQMAARGVGILLIEHLLKAVERLCDRVYVMVAGKVLTSGTYAEVMASSEVQAAYLGVSGGDESAAVPEPLQV
jgi:ABC-type branched-subunit amino acid transport system ATPase component